MWVSIKRTFLRHEMWVLRSSIAFPILANFLFATLLIWALFPVVIFILLTELFRESWPQTVGAFSGLVSITILLMVAPWFFRWVMVNFSLMLGSGEIAEAKKKDLRSSLSALPK